MLGPAVRVRVHAPPAAAGRRGGHVHGSTLNDWHNAIFSILQFVDTNLDIRGDPGIVTSVPTPGEWELLCPPRASPANSREGGNALTGTTRTNSPPKRSTCFGTQSTKQPVATRLATIVIAASATRKSRRPRLLITWRRSNRPNGSTRVSGRARGRRPAALVREATNSLQKLVAGGD